MMNAEHLGFALIQNADAETVGLAAQMVAKALKGSDLTGGAAMSALSCGVVALLAEGADARGDQLFLPAARVGTECASCTCIERAQRRKSRRLNA